MNAKYILRLSLAAIALLGARKSFAQDDFAVIKDSDGFANVRSGGTKSTILGRIYKYQIFDCTDDWYAGQNAGMTVVEWHLYEKNDGPAAQSAGQ